MIAHDHNINSYSAWKKINGGLPQGTRLGPLLFAVLVSSLLKDWPGRIKFVDDTTAIVIPRCSPIAFYQLS